MTALVLHVPLERLKSTLAPLRGERTERETTLAPQPLRVAAAGDGFYEILDGFKRLARWRAEGRREVPVVVESASGVALKARLLQANAPPKTAGPMDEARVTASLADEDGLSVGAIARLLGHPGLTVRARKWLGIKGVVVSFYTTNRPSRADQPEPSSRRTGRGTPSLEKRSAVCSLGAAKVC